MSSPRLASPSLCLSPEWWTTSKIKLDKRSRLFAGRLELFDGFKIPPNELWSVQIESDLLSRYKRGSKAAQTIARNICCVVSYMHSAFVKD